MTSVRPLLRILACLAFAAQAPLPAAYAQFVPQGGKLIGPGALGTAGQGSSVAVSGDGSTAIVGGPADSSGAGAAWIFVRSGNGWVQQGGKLTAAGASGGAIPARIGTSAAISFDGNTAIVGAPGDDGGAGGAWVFTRTGSAWSRQGGKLLGALAVNGFGGARQGQSVGISWDGNTAIVGGPLDSLGTGAAWVFTRSAGTWTQQGPKIVSTTSVGEALQGWSVALSGDGTTAIVGGIYDYDNAGAAWIFVRSGNAWVQQGYKLYGIDATGGANQGWSVALSYDGGTAIMGGPGDGSGTGAAWTFRRTNGIWSQETLKLVGTGASGSASQGTSVALSSDGNTALVGGPGDSAGTGAAWVFTRSPDSWSQQGGKITGSGAANGDYGAGEGSALALAADGTIALIAGPTDNGGAGAVWSFSRSGSSWGADGEKFLGTDARGNASQGTSVALSADGGTAVVGGPTDSTGRGAAWVFTRSGASWRNIPGKLVADTGLSSGGRSVTMSGDGTTCVIGAPGDSGGTGGAWMFARGDSLWTRRGGKIRGSGSVDTAGGAAQGTSVAFSGDGLTLIIGGPGDNGGRGAAWVFARNGLSWIQQGSKLVGSGGAGRARQGTSVALSADGRTALLGGPSDSSGAGAVWVFVRASGGWTQAGGKLRPSAGAGPSALGTALALSADGGTAIAGAPSDNAGAGAAWVFTRTADAWVQAGSRLTPTDGDPSSAFGSSVSLASDGGTAVIGGPSDDAGTGALWVFSRAGEAWVQEGGKLLCADPSGSAFSGTSVALSADGSTFVSGGPADNSGAGAVWVFARSPASVHTAAAPSQMRLERNYPNPFNPTTTIRFAVPADGEVSLEVYTVLGQRVARLAEGRLGAGEHSVRFDGSGLASGVYIARLLAGGRALAEKLLLVR